MNMPKTGARRIGASDASIAAPPGGIIEFWTGTGFIGGGTCAYRDAKLFRTRKDAEDVCAAMIVADPNRFMGYLEVIEQVVWADIRK